MRDYGEAEEPESEGSAGDDASAQSPKSKLLRTGSGNMSEEATSTSTKKKRKRGDADADEGGKEADDDDAADGWDAKSFSTRAAKAALSGTASAKKVAKDGKAKKWFDRDAYIASSCRSVKAWVRTFGWKMEDPKSGK